MFFSAVLQAVKKGPNSRGGLVWKTHAFWKTSKTRKANAVKRLKFINANHAVLKEAAALEAKQALAGAAAKVSAKNALKKPLWPTLAYVRKASTTENAESELNPTGITN